jgi:hypothetical protein
MSVSWLWQVLQLKEGSAEKDVRVSYKKIAQQVIYLASLLIMGVAGKSRQRTRMHEHMRLNILFLRAGCNNPASNSLPLAKTTQEGKRCYRRTSISGTTFSGETCLSGTRSMLFDLTFPCYLTTFSGKRCVSGKVICAFFCPAYGSPPVLIPGQRAKIPTRASLSLADTDIWRTKGTQCSSFLAPQSQYIVRHKE